MKDVLQEIKEVWQESIRFKRHEPVEDHGGHEAELNPNWKGGISKNYQRRVGTLVKKKRRSHTRGKYDMSSGRHSEAQRRRHGNFTGKNIR